MQISDSLVVLSQWVSGEGHWPPAASGADLQSCLPFGLDRPFKCGQPEGLQEDTDWIPVLRGPWPDRKCFPLYRDLRGALTGCAFYFLCSQMSKHDYFPWVALLSN